MLDPLPPATADIFGSTLERPARGDFDVTAGDDQIELFKGTSGLFNNYDVVEETKTVPGGKPLAAAVTADGAVTIVATARAAPSHYPQRTTKIHSGRSEHDR